ncbi:hypothetical protein MNBD_UNCLBAC01-1403 [hydrothermal vent metagenome]|uniref:Rrf2 family transcriptional regulator n=1 Tax=hydrothermal vent metagenome TaxID=652676 RepID=A0A3B1D3R2_9ZZZZ
MRLYSKASEYAITALTNISINSLDDHFTIKGLCEKTHVRASYARKAFQSLSQGGILKAVTGPGGGYRFNKSPEKITLLEVIQCIDGNDAFDKCVLGPSFCNDNQGCPMHETWKPIKKKVLTSFKKVTLDQLIKLNKPVKKEK